MLRRYQELNLLIQKFGFSLQNQGLIQLQQNLAIGFWTDQFLGQFPKFISERGIRIINISAFIIKLSVFKISNRDKNEM